MRHHEFGRDNEQMKRNSDQQRDFCDGDSVYRSASDAGQQGKHSSATHERLHNQMNWKKRSLPQIAAFALAEKKRLYRPRPESD